MKKTQPSRIDQSVKTVFGVIEFARINPDSGMYEVAVVRNDGQLIGGVKDTPDAPGAGLSTIDYKSIKHSPDAGAFISVKDKESTIAGGVNNRITSTKDYGNFVVGPTTFTSHPEAVKFGGVYRLNGLMTSTMPSTIVTPVSTFVLDLPGVQIIKTLTGVLNDYKGILGI